MKANIIRWLGGASIGLALGGVTLFTSGCASHETASTPGLYGANYDYEYYPDWNVYYYPAGGTYEWYEHGHWRSGGHLPPRYTIGHARHERIRAHSQEPWREQETRSEAAPEPYPYPSPDDFAAHGD